jgi:hypothetical protein
VHVQRQHQTYQRYFSVKQLGQIEARRRATRLAARLRKRPRLNGQGQRGRYCIHRTPVRAQSGIRGVSRARTPDMWRAVWYDPPAHRNSLYGSFSEVVRARKAAERRIKRKAEAQ